MQLPGRAAHAIGRRRQESRPMGAQLPGRLLPCSEAAGGPYSCSIEKQQEIITRAPHHPLSHMHKDTKSHTKSYLHNFLSLLVYISIFYCEQFSFHKRQKYPKLIYYYYCFILPFPLPFYRMI